MNRTCLIGSVALLASANVCAETCREHRRHRADLHVGRQTISPVVRSKAEAPSSGQSSSLRVQERPSEARVETFTEWPTKENRWNERGP